VLREESERREGEKAGKKTSEKRQLSGEDSGQRFRHNTQNREMGEKEGEKGPGLARFQEDTGREGPTGKRLDLTDIQAATEKFAAGSWRGGGWGMHRGHKNRSPGERG